MVYRGHVKNGVVVLNAPGALPEGVEVSVHPLKRKLAGGNGKKLQPTPYDRYKHFIGKAQGLPPDFSTNHDHYLYGTPKRK
jgi:hypothetical protein